MITSTKPRKTFCSLEEKRPMELSYHAGGTMLLKSERKFGLNLPRLGTPVMFGKDFENGSIPWQDFTRIQMKIFQRAPKGNLRHYCANGVPGPARMSGTMGGVLLVVGALTGFVFSTACAQQTDSATSIVVQPGAPGNPSKRLPPSTTATLPPKSHADVEFMQGMIMHHAQAIVMTALIASHTENKDLRSLGARISSSQSDEIKFMKRWLAARGESSSMASHSSATGAMAEMNMPDMSHGSTVLMPGMLTPEQMEALRKAKGAEFDHLFLTGMIQHHGGALTMVKDLFDTAGAGQDAELFNFATDVDNGQRAEIKIMQTMLVKKSSEEKR